MRKLMEALKSKKAEPKKKKEAPKAKKADKADVNQDGKVDEKDVEIVKKSIRKRKSKKKED